MKFNYKFWNRKQWLTFVGVLIIATAMVLGWSWYNKLPNSHLFFGQITSINKNPLSIKVSGFFVKDDQSFDKKNTKDVIVYVDNNTKLVHTIMHRPSEADLVKSKGVWDMSKVKKDIVPGQPSDLNSGLAVTVKTNNGIWNKTEFNASEVDYTTISD